MTRGALVRWLQGLEAHELGEVLRRRPDALTAPSPGDLGQLAARLSARAAVAEVVATLPLPALQVVEALARLGDPPFPHARLAEALGRGPDDPEFDATLRVLSQRALVWPDGDDVWTTSHLLLDAAARNPPEEPFAPVPPAPALVPADRAAIRAATAESADALLQHAAGLLEEAAERPLARQRNGGVAAREHARLAGPLGLDEALVAHFADVVLHAGLLGPDGAHLQPTTAYPDWLDAPPAERLARLLTGWWNGPPGPARSAQNPHEPHRATPGPGRSARNPLEPDRAPPGPGRAPRSPLEPDRAEALRRVVVRVLHDLPPDTAVAGADSLAPLVRWTAPLTAREVADLPAAVEGVLAEAALLGVCALTAADTFAVGPLGRALADGRPVAEVARTLLPAPPPPDPLRVRPVGSVVVCDDPQLLDEVAAALGLERFAPTVAGFREPAADALAALRAAGYRPVTDGPRVTLRRAPTPLGERPADRRARPRPAVDPGELARRLAVPMQRNAAPLEQIRHRAPQLRPEQAQLLADAVEHGTPIWIRYVDVNGRASERVIEDAELAGSVIEAWCRLRRDDRAFTLDKIVAVARPRE
ncbi:hypothetical protein ABT297_05075 [Dactylosporangium sp. NPDC000555]|uniref:hypothetical protein n=1 Tax=Dactylosporangium sp. NPDC000555 TaxID=3154260 RepID=UPI00332C73A5